MKDQVKGCQETTGMIGDNYIRCGTTPVVAEVTFVSRNEGPYAMCHPCMDHNVRNRGGTITKWLEEGALTEEDKAYYAQKGRVKLS